MAKIAHGVLGFLLFSLVHVSAEAEWLYQRHAIMGTDINITLWHSDERLAQKAASLVESEMHRIDGLLSPYKPESELSQLNRSASKKPFVASPELFRIVERALHYSRLSEGAFDISFAAVGQHYDYRKGLQPDAKTKAKYLSGINFLNIELDAARQSIFFKHKHLQIDLGGIAKGYAVDRSIELVKSLGIEHASVSAGGDSSVLGDKRGRPWLVGIKNPRGQPGVALSLPLLDAAISTSGDYERFFIDEDSGERIHHIINPASGEAVGGLASVSVIGPEGFDTDPLSTTVFVLGLEKGLRLIERLPEFDCIIIDRKGKVHYSSGFQSPEH
mgnify:CR=1 FL=1